MSLYIRLTKKLIIPFILNKNLENLGQYVTYIHKRCCFNKDNDPSSITPHILCFIINIFETIIYFLKHIISRSLRNISILIN